MPRISPYGTHSTFESSQFVNPSLIESSNEPDRDEFLDDPLRYRPVRPKSMDAGNLKSKLDGQQGTRKVLRSLQNEEFRRPFTTSIFSDVKCIPFFGDQRRIVKEIEENDIVLTRDIIIDSNPESPSLPDGDRKKYSKQDTLILPRGITKIPKVDRHPYTGFSIPTDLFQHAKRLLVSILALLYLIYHFCRQLLNLPFGRSVVQYHLSRFPIQSTDTHEDCLSSESVPTSPTETDVEEEFAVENLLFGCHPTPEAHPQTTIPYFSTAHRPFITESFLDGIDSESYREGTDRSTLVSTLTDLSSRLDDQGNIPLLHFNPRQGRCLAQYDCPILRLQRTPPKKSLMNRIFNLPRHKDFINVGSAFKWSPFQYGDRSDISDFETNSLPSNPDEDEFFMPTGHQV